MTFSSLELNNNVIEALNDLGYSTPTDIQQRVIPEILADYDVVGCAQTGTGKTAAFAIPIINKIHRIVGSKTKRKQIRTLVLAPTRELAVQIASNFEELSKFTGITTFVLYGGVSQDKQVKALKQGLDVLVTTPGRFLDLYKQNYISLDAVHQLVIDEADLMLDMGFLNDVKKIMKVSPANRQTLLFSATMPSPIRSLIDEFLNEPKHITINPSREAQEKISQRVYFVEKEHKKKLLALIAEENPLQNAIIFTRTKKGADLVADFLNGHQLKAGAFHGDKSQDKRLQILDSFKKKELSVLVATDVASRGIDINDISLIINYDIPNIPEVYIHRIGRTGRAGKSGRAISFVGKDEKSYWKDILQLVKTGVREEANHPYPWVNSSRENQSTSNVKSSRPSNKPKSRKSANSKKKKKRWY